jgi:hypothetical protein
VQPLCVFTLSLVIDAWQGTCIRCYQFGDPQPRFRNDFNYQLQLEFQPITLRQGTSCHLHYPSYDFFTASSQSLPDSFPISSRSWFLASTFFLSTISLFLSRLSDSSLRKSSKFFFFGRREPAFSKDTPGGFGIKKRSGCLRSRCRS